MAKTYQKARAELYKLGCSKIAATNTRFFKMKEGEYGYGDHFLGIRTPDLRILAKAQVHLPLKDIPNFIKSKF